LQKVNKVLDANHAAGLENKMDHLIDLLRTVVENQHTCPALSTANVNSEPPVFNHLHSSSQLQTQCAMPVSFRNPEHQIMTGLPSSAPSFFAPASIGLLGANPLQPQLVQQDSEVLKAVKMMCIMNVFNALK
jgi:hypothetical protein